MKIVIAPDSFKGSLSSQQVIACISQSALEHFESIQIVDVPSADGGDGTVEALVHATGGRTIQAQARDPLGRMIECFYGEANGTAVVGMAEPSGLALLSPEERNPLEASSHGTGDVIRKALDDGYSEILVGIGGSATNDCGCGALQALGMRFFRDDGSEIGRMCGKELINVARVDASVFDARLKRARVTVMCDVTNPLTGKEGATYVYGPQKGGTPDRLEKLEAGMIRFGSILNACAGRDIITMPGAGAAGGIGVSLHVFAGAELCRGIDAVLSLVEFDKLLRDADMVITGEGRVDYQSAFGKVVHGVAQYAKAARVPVIVIAGSIGDGAEAVYDLGVSTMVALPDAPMTLEYCIENAADLMKKAADRVFTLIRLGRSMKCD